MQKTTKLEICTSIPAHPKASVIFAHGICHSAWCWHHFMKYFSSHGFACYAVSYRGHGKSDGKKGWIFNNANDVGEAVERALREFPENKLFLIGHSMGGAVVQKYAGKNHMKLSGLILLASATAPSMPWISTTKGTLTRKELRIAFKKALGCNVSREELRNAGFFTGSDEGIDDEDMALALDQLENEALRVLFMSLYLRYAKNYKLACPVLVVGSKSDAYFPESSLEQTARTYRDAGTVVQIDDGIFNGICHDMMLDKRWKEVADVILKFMLQEIPPE